MENSRLKNPGIRTPEVTPSGSLEKKGNAHGHHDHRKNRFTDEPVQKNPLGEKPQYNTHQKSQEYGQRINGTPIS